MASNPGLPLSAVSRRPADKAAMRTALISSAGLSDRRTPERQPEPKPAPPELGLTRRTNGFHAIPGADAR
jgi:hypothetical protein